MDSVIDNALKTRAELRRQLAEVEQFLSLYDKFRVAEAKAEKAEKLLEPKPEHSGERMVIGRSANETTKGQMRRPGLTKEALKPHLMSAILEAGRPLTRGELLRALDRDGIVVGGIDRSKNMGTIMWRLKDSFTNLEGFGYWPRAESYPSAGYYPEAKGPEEPVASPA